MSSDTFELSAEKREVVGKKVKHVRAEGFVPATLYEKGQESINVSVEYMPLSKAYASVGQSQPIELSVGSKKYLTMIKDVHMDPVKNTIMHVAFHAVNKNDPIEAQISIHLEGDAPAVAHGNILNRPNDHVTVKAIPSEMPDFIAVSIEALENPGDTLTVADIKAIPNLEVISDSAMTLAIIEEPRAEEEEPEAEEVVDAADVPADKGGDKPEESGDSEAK